jgi:hypothetical protein
VKEDWKKKALSAGEDAKVADATASLVAASFRNLGKALGKTAAEAYERFARVKIIRGEHLPEDTSFDFGASAEPAGLDEARAAISRMSPENRAMAQAWMDYTQGKSEKRPVVTPDMEKRLARFGVVDPAGFPYEENGRSMERGIGGRKVFNPMPDELRRVLEDKRAHAAGKFSEYDQAALHPEASRLLHEDAQTKDHAALAEDIYRDHATGALNEAAFKKLPQPEGTQVAVFETGNIKNMNDHPEHGATKLRTDR